jgi:flavin reductase
VTDLHAFKLGMRRLAAGVSLITTREDGTPYGLVATSVTSLTGDPPTLLVCVNAGTSSHDPLARSGTFCVNLLPHSAKDLADRFSDPTRRHERFVEADWTTLHTGAPSLRGAIATFDCTVEKAVRHHTHTIFIGRIEAIALDEAPIAPLVYLDGRYHELRERAA